MRDHRLALALGFLVAGGLLMGGCGRTSAPADDSQTQYLWIAADKDTWVWFEYPDSQWGQDGYLRVAYLGDNKRSFVHFFLPNLPEGTEVLEAYVELYHGGTTEDGYSDDLDIKVQRAAGAWSPGTLTWNNQPAFGRATEFTIQLRSAAWSASGDIAGIVQEMVDAPASYHGFIVDYFDPGLSHGIEKGFDSNNHSRTAQDLAHAPRLLAKVLLPAGKTMNDVTLPAIPADNDLDFPPGTSILMLRYSSGPDWPAAWDVVAAED